MDKVLVIAKNTFKESLRDRILYGIFGFALIFIFLTIFLAPLTLGQDIKFLRDFGMAGIYLFSFLITVFLGASLIYKEIERRTIYLVLAKPVGRWHFILGKFFGLFASVSLVVALMAGVYLALIGMKGGGFDAGGLAAILMQLPELAIFIALAIVFSSFTRPLTSVIYSTLLLYIGHSLDIYTRYARRAAEDLEKLLMVFYYILPNFEKFNIRNSVIYDTPLSLNAIMFAVLYAAAYSAVLLIIGRFLLERKEL